MDVAAAVVVVAEGEELNCNGLVEEQAPIASCISHIERVGVVVESSEATLCHPPQTTPP
jgi:hypothetical protein